MFSGTALSIGSIGCIRMAVKYGDIKYTKYTVQISKRRIENLIETKLVIIIPLDLMGFLREGVCECDVGTLIAKDTSNFNLGLI